MREAFEYPINSTARVFHDSEGNPTTLYKLVRSEPEWAQSRLIHLEQTVADQQKLIDSLASDISQQVSVIAGLHNTIAAKDKIIKNQEIEIRSVMAA